MIVSIIIPTYKDWDRLQLCLQALQMQTYSQDLFEIIIVNNAPQDIRPKHFKIPGNCILISEAKPGSYAARNSALAICRGSIVGFTDSDCIPDKNWIKNAVGFFRDHPEIERIGGAIQIFFKSHKPSKVELYDEIFAFPQKAYVESGNAVTANMFTYRESFDKIGLFDSSLLSGGDYQWGKRAFLAGCKIGYAPNVLVKHPARPSVKDLVEKAKRVGKGQAKFKKNNRAKEKTDLIKILALLKPRIWEIKMIFKKGKKIGFLNKLYLVFLRHYIVIVGDLTRIRN